MRCAAAAPLALTLGLITLPSACCCCCCADAHGREGPPRLHHHRPPPRQPRLRHPRRRALHSQLLLPAEFLSLIRRGGWRGQYLEAAEDYHWGNVGGQGPEHCFVNASTCQKDMWHNELPGYDVVDEIFCEIHQE